jgi:succinoglycan biosynthesis transport protein ExoP
MIDSRALTQGASTGRGVREAVRFVNRNKIIIFSPMVLVAGVAWMIASATQPRFVANAVLALDVHKIQIVDREIVSRLPQESAALRTELDVVGSRSAAEAVVDRLALTSDAEILREVGVVSSLWQNLACDAQQALPSWFPWIEEICLALASSTIPSLSRTQIADWIVGNVKVSNDGRSLTISVTFTSENPALAARIANGIAETYLDEQVRTKAVATVKARDWLHEQLIKIRRELEISEAAVDDFRRQSGLNETKGTTLPSQILGELNSQVVTARSDQARAEAKLQIARESDPATIPDVLASPMIQQLRRDLAQIDAQIAENRVRGTVYKLDTLEARAAAARKQMSQEMNRILASFSTEVQAARKKEGELTRAFQAMESQASDAAHANFRLNQLQREADANRSMYETFLSRYKDSMEQEGLAAPDARVISRGEIPSVPTYPNKLRFLLLGTIGGLAVGGALAFLREGFDRRIRQPSDVEIVTGVPVFGLLPKVSRWRSIQAQDYPVKDPHSRFCAALARIDTAIRAPKASDRKHVILVTSPQPGDGKTSFCISLARSLAKNRLRVLVVDADPYRSQVPSSFGVSISQAFAPIVNRPARLGDIVQADSKSAAHFIPAPKEDDFQLLIHSGGFTTLLDEARQAYDIIIIDTPPVMTSAEAALIGRFADTRLLLVRWGRTSWDELTAAVGFLQLCRAGLDGIVIVGAESGSATYGQLASYDTAPSGTRFTRPASYRSLSEVE